MRLWSLHPQYLDSKGLVALWRESLLAQAVLRGKTQGYRNHPQLARFKACSYPFAAMSAYLTHIQAEATARGYKFNIKKIEPANNTVNLSVTSGQLAYEWSHLMTKLKNRDPALYQKWQGVTSPSAHPLFTVHRGEVASWERL